MHLLNVAFSETSHRQTFENSTCKKKICQEVVYSLCWFSFKCMSYECYLKQKICEMLSDVWLSLFVHV